MKSKQQPKKEYLHGQGCIIPKKLHTYVLIVDSYEIIYTHLQAASIDEAVKSMLEEGAREGEVYVRVGSIVGEPSFIPEK
jgi:hypothetical protein